MSAPFPWGIFLCRSLLATKHDQPAERLSEGTGKTFTHLEAVPKKSRRADYVTHRKAGA